MTLQAKLKIFFILGTLLAVSCRPQGTKGGYQTQIKQEKVEEYGLGIDGGITEHEKFPGGKDIEITTYGGNKEPFPKNPYPKEPSPKDPFPKDPSPKDPYPKDPYPKDPYPKDPYPKEPSPKDPFPKDPYPKDPYPKDPYPKDPYPKEPSPKEPFPKDPYPKEPFPKDPFPKDPYPKDPYPKDPSPKDPYPKDPYPKDPSPKDPFPKDQYPIDDKGHFPEDANDKDIPKDKNYGQGSSIDRSDEGFGHRRGTGIKEVPTGNFFKCFVDGYHWLDCLRGKRPSNEKDEQIKDAGHKGRY